MTHVQRHTLQSYWGFAVCSADACDEQPGFFPDSYTFPLQTPPQAIPISNWINLSTPHFVALLMCAKIWSTIHLSTPKEQRFLFFFTLLKASLTDEDYTQFISLTNSLWMNGVHFLGLIHIRDSRQLWGSHRWKTQIYIPQQNGSFSWLYSVDWYIPFCSRLKSVFFFFL